MTLLKLLQLFVQPKKIMKKTFYDEYEGRDFEADIPDDLYKKAYEENDYDALYEVGIILETETEMSFAAIAEIMEKAYADGKGSDDARYWLEDYRYDDGRFDAWS